MKVNIADLRRKRFGVYRTRDELANAHVILIEGGREETVFETEA
jgi:hypothetical protein